jgi:hypothetical protein
MADPNTYHVSGDQVNLGGNVSGGQISIGGSGNTFNQVNGPDPAVAKQLGLLRANLGDFPDPEAAARKLAEIEKASAAAHPGRLHTLLEDLRRYAPLGTEAALALTALITAVQGIGS